MAEHVVKLLGQQGFRGLGLLGNGAHLVEQVGHTGLLLRQLTGQIAAFVRIAQGLLFGVGQALEIPGQFLLLLGELPRVVAHLAHLVGELAGAFLAEIIAELLQVALGAGA